MGDGAKVIALETELGLIGALALEKTRSPGLATELMLEWAQLKGVQFEWAKWMQSVAGSKADWAWRWATGYAPSIRY